ncbi:hypothetical protein ACFQX6_39780 [Streptosporangium lutulentum]
MLGALVRSEPGIVVVRLHNAAAEESGELVADIGLPDGVTLLAAARRGRAVVVVTPVGTVDGWSCRMRARGARCTRGSLAADQATAVFLRVLVSSAAGVKGSAPSVTVSAGGVRTTARSSSGVRAAGAPARFATDGRVVTSAIGNTLLSCVRAGSACGAARSRTGDRRDNNHWAMRPFDKDGDPSTTNSSAAQLLLPRTSKLVWAPLLVGERAFQRAGQVQGAGGREIQEGEGGAGGGEGLPSGRRYQAFADVTRLVGEVRGTYWVADASLRPGVSQHAGWSLVIIAADPSWPYSQAVVVDTATVLDGGHRSVRIPLNGLTSTGTPARVALVTWEGDASVRGDRVTLGGRTLRPDSGDRDPRNPFDGSATGARDTSVTFGTDVDGFQATLGRDPVLTVSTRQDVLLFGAAVVSVRMDS